MSDNYHNIIDKEREISNLLISKFLEQKNNISYANIGPRDEYLGWVLDFNLKHNNCHRIGLDLRKENDLFLLFVLAVVWSRSGQWENSVYFVSYLKTSKKDTKKYWSNELNYIEEEAVREKNAKEISSELSGIIPRVKVSFRKDIFSSIYVLAEKWDEILDLLKASDNEKDFTIFMKYFREIEGLCFGNKKMLIKIPLILRELRCQNIYSNISGDLCCVPDKRVIETAEKLKIIIPRPTNLTNLIKSSQKIYSLFGDLYDLPLFAYEDLQ